VDLRDERDAQVVDLRERRAEVPSEATIELAGETA
jgi:hypothetical protein